MAEDSHIFEEIAALLRRQTEQLDALLRRDERLASTMASMDARREDARTEQASVRWEEREFRAQLIALAQKQAELLERLVESGARGPAGLRAGE
jgi:hypothetical protein